MRHDGVVVGFAGHAVRDWYSVMFHQHRVVRHMTIAMIHMSGLLGVAFLTNNTTSCNGYAQHNIKPHLSAIQHTIYNMQNTIHVTHVYLF